MLFNQIMTLLFCMCCLASHARSESFNNEFRDFCFDRKSGLCLAYNSDKVTAFSEEKHLKDGLQLKLEIDGSIQKVRPLTSFANTFLVVVSRGIEEDSRPRSNKPLVINRDLYVLQVDPESLETQRFMKIATHIWDAFSMNESVFGLFQDGVSNSPELYSDDYFWCRFQTFSFRVDDSCLFQEAVLLSEAAGEYSLVSNSISFTKSMGIPVLVNRVTDRHAEILGYIDINNGFRLSELSLEYPNRKRSLADSSFQWDRWHRNIAIDINFEAKSVASIVAFDDSTYCTVWDLETGRLLMEYKMDKAPTNELDACADCHIFESAGVIFSYGRNILSFDFKTNVIEKISSKPIDETVENVKILGFAKLGESRRLRVLLVQSIDAYVTDIEF